jgi:malate dehydrogenase
MAAKAGKKVGDVQKLVVWGNHSPTMYPDIRFATLAGQPAPKLVDENWYRTEYIPKIGKRGAAVIEARGLSSAASAGNAAIMHMHDWALGSGGEWVTMGIPSDGSYGIPEDVLYGFPVTCTPGKYEMVKGLEIDDFSRSKMDATLKELLEEQAAVKPLLS